MAALEIKNLSFSYPTQQEGEKALDDISLSIAEGEFVLVCGPSGCGKSTLLRQIKPSLRPHGRSSGSVMLNGRSVNELSFREQTEQIGFVLQDPEMQLVTDKVWHELAFGLESLGMENSKMRVRIAEIANYFGIQTYLDASTAELSGGQKQLICLAGIMAMQPELLLLDEPTSQLDPIAAGEFFSALKRINEETGTTVVITEHRYENLFSIADRVVFMENGRVIGNCSPRRAVSELSGKQDYVNILPAAMRLYAETTSSTDNAPITVREGRSYLRSIIGQKDESEEIGKTNPQKEKREPILSVNDVWFRYERSGKDVLKGLGVDFFRGELSCVIGANGAGKTTAIMNAAGLYKPYRGKVRFDGKDIRTYKSSELYGRRIALLVQNPACCFVKDTVREELESVRKHFELTGDRLDEVIDLMELAPILDRHPYDISGGELQRAAIARLLLPNPEIIFMDEATKGMDAFFKQRFGLLLKRLTANGTSIVMVSHDIEFCAEYADRCAMIFDGGITAEGSCREVLIDNSFYTTAANRLSRGIVHSVLTVNELIDRVK